MRTYVLLLWSGLIAVAVGVGAGCQSVERTATTAVVPVAIADHHHNNDPGLPSHEVVLVNSRRELEALGSTDLVNTDIDFANTSLLVLSLGGKPTGGYWVCITGVQRQGEKLYVQGVVNQPGPDEAVAQTVTHPYCAVETEKIYGTTVYPEIEAVTGMAMPQ